MKGLAQTLVLTGAVRAPDMSAALAKAGDGPELQQLLVSEHLATEAQIAEAIAVHTGHRYYDISEIEIPQDVLALVPGNLCRRYQLIPLDRMRGKVIVGMLDPTDIIAIDDVTSLTDLQVEAVVVAADSLRQAFERYLRSDEELSDLSEQIGETAGSASGLTFTEALDDQDADAPVVRFVNLLITQAINDRASDIHIEPGEQQLTVRFRIDGVLHEMQRADRAIQDGVISRLKIMSAIDIAERRRPQDGRLHELRDAIDSDDDVAGVVTDVDHGEGFALGAEAPRDACEPERDEVDRVDLELRFRHGGNELFDGLGHGGNEKAGDLAIGFCRGVEIEHGLAHRHREEVLHLVRQRLAQKVGAHRLGGVFPNENAPATNRECHLAALDSRARPELTQRQGDGISIENFGVFGCAWRQGHFTCRDEGGSAPRRSSP
ncbi:ATPase, T2SS/T4P/T4SS family [Microbacterium sp. C7(2022)]|nr:ATPase, T2SS/T4P/T4SS family [Microbacterium sp. C7(2022)]MDE0546720.1 ATPase, T2SS/T4P/T4SS family [Microbacterium sp. C7(2022)]